MTIAANIAARKAREAVCAQARKDAEEIVAAYEGQPDAFWACLGALCDARLPKVGPNPQAATEAPVKAGRTPPADVEEILEEIDATLERINDLPERAQEFGESVGATLRGIAETIELTGMATAAQQRAITNISAGVGRWFKDD